MDNQTMAKKHKRYGKHYKYMQRFEGCQKCGECCCSIWYKNSLIHCINCAIYHNLKYLELKEDLRYVYALKDGWKPLDCILCNKHKQPAFATLCMECYPQEIILSCNFECIEPSKKIPEE